MVNKIPNELNDLKINRANGKMLNIDRILQLNNQKGGNPDANQNDDKNVFAVPARSIKLKVIEQEMKGVRKLLNELGDLVEEIDDINIKNKFRKNIAELENDRLDIVDDVQDRINARNRENNPVPAENRPLAIESADILIIKGGDTGVPKDWT